MEVADRPVIIGERGFDAAGRLQLIIHAQHERAVFSVRELLLDPLRRDLQRREEGFGRKRNLGRRCAALGKGAFENAREAGRGVDDELGSARAIWSSPAGGSTAPR